MSSRNQRRLYQKQANAEMRQLPAALEEVPASELPDIPGKPIRCWRSRRFAVQLYAISHADIPGLLRLSVNRSAMKSDGRWEDGITWDELQQIKHDVGYGDYYAIEVYPRDGDLVNDANMRHLWILPLPLPIGWFTE